MKKDHKDKPAYHCQVEYEGEFKNNYKKMLNGMGKSLISVVAKISKENDSEAVSNPAVN